ncbi:hypothetical protein BJX65DRAFT_306591 [Aspergillus insuetus]
MYAKSCPRLARGVDKEVAAQLSCCFGGKPRPDGESTLNVLNGEDEDDIETKRKQIEKDVIEELTAKQVMDHYREIQPRLTFSDLHDLGYESQQAAKADEGEALYVKKLAVSMGLQVDEAIPVHTDSDNAVDLLGGPNCASPSSVRWIESRYFFVKDVLQKKQIELLHVDGSENPADGFTNPFDKAEHDNYVAKLNMAKN